MFHVDIGRGGGGGGGGGFPGVPPNSPLGVREGEKKLGARWLLPEVVVFSGTSSWSVHFQCRGGSSFKILRGFSLPNISRQGGKHKYYQEY